MFTHCSDDETLAGNSNSNSSRSIPGLTKTSIVDAFTDTGRANHNNNSSAISAAGSGRITPPAEQ